MWKDTLPSDSRFIITDPSMTPAILDGWMWLRRDDGRPGEVLR
jgi:hypothetical protein